MSLKRWEHQDGCRSFIFAECSCLPAFDTLDDTELMAFWSRYHRASRADAEQLIGDRRAGFTGIAATLANYACNLAVARKCLADGDTDGHAIHMHSVGLCNERLPIDIRERMWAAGNKARPLSPAPEPKPIGHPFNPNK